MQYLVHNAGEQGLRELRVGLGRQKVKLKDNQFGGVRGFSTAHLLINIMQDICENAEDYCAATVIASIDYSKAFNWLSFQHCLRAKKGVSRGIIRLIATFLSNRLMPVRVNVTWSAGLTTLRKGALSTVMPLLRSAPKTRALAPGSLKER